MEQIFDWKKRFYQVHKPDRVDPQAAATLTGTKVTDGWKVIPQAGTGVVLNNVAWDLTDYFAVSMNTASTGTNDDVSSGCAGTQIRTRSTMI